MNQAAAAGPFSIDRLRGELIGSVIGPDDAGYDDARVVLYHQHMSHEYKVSGLSSTSHDP